MPDFLVNDLYPDTWSASDLQHVENADLADKICRLGAGAARLLLALLACPEMATLKDLPTLIARAGLAIDERNTHGKNRYGRAFQQLVDLGFITVYRGVVVVLFQPAV